MKRHSFPQVLLLILALACAGFLVSAVLARAGSPAADVTSYPPPGALVEPVVTPLRGIVAEPVARPGRSMPTKELSDTAKAALAYLAESKNIPASSLIVANELSVEQPNTGRKFQAVKLLDARPDGGIFELWVNLDTGEVIEDIESVRMQEDAARFEKYGKLQPGLYERLQLMGDNDVATVSIWVISPPGQSLSDREQAAIATLAAKYPKAKAAMEDGGKPMDVADPTLAAQIDSEYAQLVLSGVDQQIQPLVDALMVMGYEPITSPGLPAVTVNAMSKKDILSIAEREDVGTIYLADEGE